MAGEWIAQLSDDLKEHEAFTSFETLSDFAKAHIDTLGKVSNLEGEKSTLEGKATDLEGKLANSIPKLGESATDEEKAAYRKAMGIPEKPEEYEFPAIEGQENDANMVAWAQRVFFEANLPKETAAYIGKQWNTFLAGLIQAEEEANEKARTDAETALKTKWGTDFDKNVEFIKRGWKKFANSEFDEWTAKHGVGHDDVLMEFLLSVGKAMGEDFSPQGTPLKGDQVKEGIIYDKSPTPPNNA